MFLREQFCGAGGSDIPTGIVSRNRYICKFFAFYELSVGAVFYPNLVGISYHSFDTDT